MEYGNKTSTVNDANRRTDTGVARGFAVVFCLQVHVYRHEELRKASRRALAGVQIATCGRVVFFCGISARSLAFEGAVDININTPR